MKRTIITAILTVLFIPSTHTQTDPGDPKNDPFIPCTYWYRREAPVNCVQREYKTCQLADGSYITLARERLLDECKQ